MARVSALLPVFSARPRYDFLPSRCGRPVTRPLTSVGASFVSGRWFGAGCHGCMVGGEWGGRTSSPPSAHRRCLDTICFFVLSATGGRRGGEGERGRGRRCCWRHCTGGWRREDVLPLAQRRSLDATYSLFVDTQGWGGSHNREGGGGIAIYSGRVSDIACRGGNILGLRAAVGGSRCVPLAEGLRRRVPRWEGLRRGVPREEGLRRHVSQWGVSLSRAAVEGSVSRSAGGGSPTPRAAAGGSPALRDAGGGSLVSCVAVGGSPASGAVVRGCKSVSDIACHGGRVFGVACCGGRFSGERVAAVACHGGRVSGSVCHGGRVSGIACRGRRFSGVVFRGGSVYGVASWLRPCRRYRRRTRRSCPCPLTMWMVSPPPSDELVPPRCRITTWSRPPRGRTS